MQKKNIQFVLSCLLYVPLWIACSDWIYSLCKSNVFGTQCCFHVYRHVYLQSRYLTKDTTFFSLDPLFLLIFLKHVLVCTSMQS